MTTRLPRRTSLSLTEILAAKEEIHAAFLLYHLTMGNIQMGPFRAFLTFVGDQQATLATAQPAGSSMILTVSFSVRP